MQSNEMILVFLLLVSISIAFCTISYKYLEERSSKKLMPPKVYKNTDYQFAPHQYNFPYDNPNIDHIDPYFSHVVPRQTLKYTSDKYRFRAISSLDAELADNMGYQSVDTPWDNVGITSTVDKDDDTILSLDKRAIDPYREWYEYRVIDKNGIVIPLKATLIEDGDILDEIVGKEGKGAFKVHLFDQNKLVYI